MGGGVIVAVGVAVGVEVGVAVAVAVAVAVGVGAGVAAAPTINFDWLGMPLVKTVTRAWPMGKPLELVVIRVIGLEVKEVSDQPATASTGRNSVCSLARLNNCTSG